MSKEFKFTPDEIRGLTLQDFGNCCERLNRDREKVAPLDVALETIKQVLITGLGVKVKVKPKDILEQARQAGIPTVSFTTAEKEAWLKAKMPEINKFLKEYRKNHGS